MAIMTAMSNATNERELGMESDHEGKRTQHLANSSLLSVDVIKHYVSKALHSQSYDSQIIKRWQPQEP